MDIEKLARKMRERALNIEAREEKKHLSERKRTQDQLDAMKKLCVFLMRFRLVRCVLVIVRLVAPLCEATNL